MSAQRDELEATQARLRSLEKEGAVELELLADSLEQACEGYERLLVRAEEQARAREGSNLGARLLTTGFTLLFGMPTVVMISASVSKLIRSEHEVAVLLMALGAVVIAAVSSRRMSANIARLFSSEWRLVRHGRRLVEALRAG